MNKKFSSSFGVEACYVRGTKEMFQLSYAQVTDEIPAIFEVGIPMSILNMHIGSGWGGAILSSRSPPSAVPCICGFN